MIDAAERDNVGLVLDFWHLWQRGTTPDGIARLDPRIIFGVDLGDSLGPPGAGTADQRSRCVWPGDGDIPLREWVAAVRSTGFDGWWDNELYSPLHWESADPFAVGVGLLEVLRTLLRGADPRFTMLTLRRARCYGCAIGCSTRGAVHDACFSARSRCGRGGGGRVGGGRAWRRRSELGTGESARPRHAVAVEAGRRRGHAG